MKKWLWLLFCVFPAFGFGQTVFAPNGNTQIEADREEWDFGKIREKDGPVEHVFTLKNISDRPFILNDVTTTCGCTVPSFSAEPVLPQDSTRITVRFDPKKRPGYFSKRIYIWSGNEGVTNVLLIKGYVER